MRLSLALYPRPTPIYVPRNSKSRLFAQRHGRDVLVAQNAFVPACVQQTSVNAIIYPVGRREHIWHLPLMTRPTPIVVFKSPRPTDESNLNVPQSDNSCANNAMWDNLTSRLCFPACWRRRASLCHIRSLVVRHVGEPKLFVRTRVLHRHLVSRSGELGAIPFLENNLGYGRGRLVGHGVGGMCGERESLRSDSESVPMR